MVVNNVSKVVTAWKVSLTLERKIYSKENLQNGRGLNKKFHFVLGLHTLKRKQRLSLKFLCFGRWEMSALFWLFSDRVSMLLRLEYRNVYFIWHFSQYVSMNFFICLFTFKISHSLLFPLSTYLLRSSCIYFYTHIWKKNGTGIDPFITFIILRLLSSIILSIRKYFNILHI